MAKGKGKPKTGTADKAPLKKEGVSTANNVPSATDMVEVVLLEAVKIGRFTYGVGRNIGLIKEHADNLILNNKAKQI